MKSLEGRSATATWQEWFARPFVGTVEAVIAILTGLAGSIFSADLRVWMAGILGVHPLSGLQPNGSSTASLGNDGWGTSGVVAFWLLLVAASMLHIMRSAAQQSLERRTQARLDASTHKIEDLVATNASPDYLQELGMSYEKARAVAATAADLAQTKLALTYTLQAVAVLARVYDVKRQGRKAGTYVTNIMWFIPRDRASEWDNVVQFRAGGVTLGGVKGVVALAAEYSATAWATDSLAPDPHAANFALDIPLQAGSADTRWSVLPGAPLAYTQDQFEHFHPAQKIVDWFTSYGDFPTSVKDKVGNYFSAHPEIAGFVSMPIYRPSPKFEEGQREILGVLNVHWSEADILDNAETARKFSQTIYPLRVLLAEQMIKVLDSEGFPRPSELATVASNPGALPAQGGSN